MSVDGSKGLEFIESNMGKKPLYLCTISYTGTSEIPGLTLAGANPEVVKFTPAADAELLYYRQCKSIPGVPATPDGVPTPALITLSALKLATIPFFILDAGSAVKPRAPYISVGLQSLAKNITTGHAMELKDVKQVFEYAKLLGRDLSYLCDYLVLGESIPAGTTTASAVLSALGIDARGKVSSSMTDNPHQLKDHVVEQSLKAARISIDKLTADPLLAISKVGDPMIATVAGLVIGAAGKAPIILAGGTQMTAVAAVVSILDARALENVVLSTTPYVTEDPQSDLSWLLKQSGDIPVLAADPGLARSSIIGLQPYGKGLVKEGVGAGGSCLASMLRSSGKITTTDILNEVERSYHEIIGT